METKDIISTLLQHNPRDRLGTAGAQDVKDHPYFDGVDWNSLLRQKVEFVPTLENDEDTSYFDSKLQALVQIGVSPFSSQGFYLK